jgi:hypothetical protein
MVSINIGAEITRLQDDAIVNWKANGIQFTQQEFLSVVEQNHAFNYQLWLAEDRARRDDKGHEFVYLAKREIDHCNQQRNNFMETMDLWLSDELKPALPSICPVHSETPGMMIDRLSILALKAYHMALQVDRPEVSHEHRETCKQKLNIIMQQRQQLERCLDALIDEVRHKTRTFRVYHQFKMYNDPALNPELYGKVSSPC